MTPTSEELTPNQSFAHANEFVTAGEQKYLALDGTKDDLRCTWCEGPLLLEDRIAWCADRDECRQKQLSCAVSIDKDGMRQYLFVPTPRQAEAMMLSFPNVFIWGNRGGGKSVCMRWYCHALALAIPGFRYIILRTSFPELMKNHTSYLENEMNLLGGEAQGYRYNKTDHVCYYANGSVGFYAQCATDADVKKVLGAEVGLVVFDEAPTFQWEHMRLIAASIRVPAGSGLTPMTRYLGNPVGESIEELWAHFIEHEVDLADNPDYDPADWVSLEMRIQDNPHLDRKQYWKQFSGLPKHYLKAWREGLRVEENALFDFYPQRTDEKTGEVRPYHVLQEVPRLSDGSPLFTVVNGEYHFPEWVQIYRSYDHGFWPDPAVCLWFAVYGRRILCFKEMTRYRTLAEDMAVEIKNESKGMRVRTSYCDPSIDVEDGTDVYTVRQKMENKGVPLDPSTNNRELFATALHAMLSEEVMPGVPRMQFLDRHCPETIKAIPKMKYDEKNPSKLADHKKDHWPIAIAYFGMTLIPVTAPTDAPKVKKRWQTPKMKNRGASSARMAARQEIRRKYGRV